MMKSSCVKNASASAAPRIARHYLRVFPLGLFAIFVALSCRWPLHRAFSQEQGSPATSSQGTSTDQAADSTEKPEVPTPTKRVAAGSQAAGTSQSSNASAGAGDVVSYCLEAVLPKDLGSFVSYKLWFCDELDKGLEYVPSSVRSYVRHRDGTTASASLDVNIEQNTMRVGSNNVLEAVPGLVPGDVLAVEYDCTVKLDALLGLVEGNQNTLTLQYSRTATTEEQSVSKVASVYSFGIDLHKVGEPDGTNLAGAGFVVQNDKGEYRASDGTWTASEDNAQVATTNEAGIASFAALGEGTYTLTETVAPQGYELLAEPVEVTLAASDLNASQRTLTATVAGTSATMEAVDGATGVATVTVEDPKSTSSTTPDNDNTPTNRQISNGTSPTSSNGTSTTPASTSATRTQLATTADPAPATSAWVAVAATGLVLVGVAKRRQNASPHDA